MLVSVIGMYLFLNTLFPKNKLGSFLGAIFYLYAPVRFLNVYVSADVGGALALGILPFVFWTVTAASQKKKWAIPIGGIFLAFLITSHNVTALMFAPILLIFSLILIYRSKEKMNIFKNLSLLALLGLGLSSFFWIPAIYEVRYIVYNGTLGNFWMTQFPSLWQIIHSAWGYGLSHPEQNDQGGVSFQIGLAHIFVALVTAGALLFFRRKKEFLTWGSFVAVLFLTSVFLQLRISYPVWEHLPLIYLVQFPSRFMTISVFTASLGAALLVKYLPFRRIVFFILIVFVLYANRNHWNINERFDPNMQYYLDRHDTTTSANEHLPKWAYLPEKESPGKLIVLKGAADITITGNKSAKVTARIDVSKDATLRFNQFYFPGWVLKDNGQSINYSYIEGGPSQGLPVFSLSKGSHIFEADFTDTPDRTLANALSILSLGTLGFLLLFLKKNGSKS